MDYLRPTMPSLTIQRVVFLIIFMDSWNKGKLKEWRYTFSQPCLPKWHSGILFCLTGVATNICPSNTTVQIYHAFVNVVEGRSFCTISWVHARSYLEKLTFTKRKTAPPKAGRGGLHLGHQNWEVRAGGSWITSQLRLCVSAAGITLLHLHKYIRKAHFRIIILELPIIYAFAILLGCLFLHFLHKEFPNFLHFAAEQVE